MCNCAQLCATSNRSAQPHTPATVPSRSEFAAQPGSRERQHTKAPRLVERGGAAQSRAPRPVVALVGAARTDVVPHVDAVEIRSVNISTLRRSCRSRWRGGVDEGPGDGQCGGPRLAVLVRAGEVVDAAGTAVDQLVGDGAVEKWVGDVGGVES
jgi:hypothetical protein